MNKLETHTIYTIGDSTRSLAEFLDMQKTTVGTMILSEVMLIIWKLKILKTPL
jgi:hypothetical protein